MSTPEEFIAALPPGRQEAITTIRATILANLPDGYEEGIRGNVLSYYVPHSICADGYHCNAEDPVPFAGLSANKKKISLHMFCLYIDRDAKDRFVTAWKKTGNKLDMGAACVRFTKLDNVPLEVIGDTIASIPVAGFLDLYEASVPKAAAKKRAWARRS